MWKVRAAGGWGYDWEPRQGEEVGLGLEQGQHRKGGFMGCEDDMGTKAQRQESQAVSGHLQEAGLPRTACAYVPGQLVSWSQWMWMCKALMNEARRVIQRDQ